jgi:hypothetical protein
MNAKKFILNKDRIQPYICTIHLILLTLIPALSQMLPIFKFLTFG